jgi:hypothetical protein
VTDDAAYLAADAEDRRHALAAAVELASHREDVYVRDRNEDGDAQFLPPEHVRWLSLADEAYRWLRDRDSLHASTITLVPGTPIKEGSTMTATIDLSDVDEITFTLSAADAKGASVPVPTDTWQWSLSDPDETGSTLLVSADTLSATVAAGSPDTTGTLTLTVTGQTSGLTGAEAILVQASAAATIGLVAGTPAAESAPASTPPAS